MYKHYECNHCDAVFKVKTLTDPETYLVYFCPYCGGDIEDEIEDEADDE